MASLNVWTTIQPQRHQSFLEDLSQRRCSFIQKQKYRGQLECKVIWDVLKSFTLITSRDDGNNSEILNIVIKKYVDENAELMAVVSLLKRMHLMQLLRVCFMLTVRQLLSLQFSSEKSYYPLWKSKNVFSQIFCASCSSLIVFFFIFKLFIFLAFFYTFIG